MTPESLRPSVSLQTLNTLRLPGSAHWFARVNEPEALPDLLQWADDNAMPSLVLGGGSNLVLVDDFPGLVLAMGIRERHWAVEDDDTAMLTLGAGENWHDSVLYACHAGYRGIENLALIPGTVGAAPVQNIGAYGAELSQTLTSLDVWDRREGCFRTLSNEQCRFAYRDSLFKQQPDRYVILRIRLRLCRTAPYHLSYGELAERFGHLRDPGKELSPRTIADTVAQVRLRKLPDPERLPNAGSFFKNPVVSPEKLAELRQAWPDIVAHPDGEAFKLAAGWMIERCGWKGHRDAHVGVHSRQALVLIHHGQGTGAELLALAERIRADVYSHFGVNLEIEPRVIMDC